MKIMTGSDGFNLNRLRLGESYPRQIALFRALPGLGDMLCAVPAMRALRAALPEAKITLIGLPWAEIFVQRFHAYLDGFIEFPGHPGLPDRIPQLRQFPAFLADIQAHDFDWVVQMHGNGNLINPLAVLLAARRTAGFYVPGRYCPDPDCFLPYPEHEPEVWRLLRLMEFLGIPNQGDNLEFPLGSADWQELHALEEAQGLQPGGYVCVHPGASVTERCWPPERFAAVADTLVESGLQVVLTGTSRETVLTEQIARMMKHRPVNLAGRTSLGALGALLSQACLLVCNDTGVSHLAAALKVPSVVIFSQSDPDRWAPLDRERHRILYSLPQAHSTSPCPETKNNGWGRDKGQVIISPEMVLAEVEILLRQKIGASV
jgi:ADP-heptose:LPS heptosyltransferase